MRKAFIIDDKVKQAVEIITDLLATPGEINIGYSDVKAIISQQGPVLLSTGSGAGNDRVLKACHDALTNSWNKTTIMAATKVLVNITGPTDLLLKEVNDGLDVIRESVSPTTEVIFGVARDSNLHDQIKVTLLAVVTSGHT
jgi:cell division protein FtsZ